MPKIIGDSLADHRELTRTRLFEALGELMTEQPFESITMSQIASRAHVGRTAVYNHFADKEVLLLAFIRRITTQFSAKLDEALSGLDDPVAQLRMYIRAHLEMTTRYHLGNGFNLRTQVSQENSAHLHDHATIVGNTLLGILSRAMEQGKIPMQNPHALIPLVHACLAGNRLPDDPQAREATVSTVQNFILRGLGVQGITAQPAARPCPEEGTRPEETPSSANAYLRCPISA